MRLLISFAALFISVALVQLGSGTLGPLDALSGAALGFSTREIGLLGSAHFAGFFVGCLVMPAMMGRVGHSRAFAAMAAIGAVGALLHPLWHDPIAWAAMRVLSGASVAGCYTIIESWLQAKAKNENRGRISSVYRSVDMGASLVAQMLIGFLDPASYVSYNIVALFMCFCLLPLALTTAVAPPTSGKLKVRLLKSIRLSPLGAAGVVTVGLTNSSFRMVGPVYGNQNGLTPAEIGQFLAAALLGGALAQPVVGTLADKFDRRWVLIALSLLALCSCTYFVSRPDAQSFRQLAFAAFMFGATAFPLYSISAAHANDFATPEFVVELNASLMVLYGIGAIVSPLLASELITAFGPSAMFVYIGTAHVALVMFGLYRMTRRAPADTKTPYTYRPRTSFTLERLLGRKKRTGLSLRRDPCRNGGAIGGEFRAHRGMRREAVAIGGDGSGPVDAHCQQRIERLDPFERDGKAAIAEAQRIALAVGQHHCKLYQPRVDRSGLFANMRRIAVGRRRLREQRADFGFEAGVVKPRTLACLRPFVQFFGQHRRAGMRLFQILRDGLGVGQ